MQGFGDVSAKGALHVVDKTLAVAERCIDAQQALQCPPLSDSLHISSDHHEPVNRDQRPATHLKAQPERETHSPIAASHYR